MNLILWVLIGIVAGTYISTTNNNQNKGESIFIAVSGSLIGGFTAALLFGYSINGLNPLAIISSLASTVIALKYFSQVTKAHGENNQQQ